MFFLLSTFQWEDGKSLHQPDRQAAGGGHGAVREAAEKGEARPLYRTAECMYMNVIEPCLRE